MNINKSKINLWDLIDLYISDENLNVDENLFLEDVKLPVKTNSSHSATNRRLLYKPHRNPLLDNYKELKAEYLPDSKGNFLLYPGMIHLIYGKPGTWKSWIALSLIGKRSVRYLDFENHGPVMAQRLRNMCVREEDAGVFDFPETKGDVLERVQEYIATRPEVVVIDGIPGLARTFGINSDANDQVEKLFQEVLMPLKRAGVAVLLLDHLPKDGPNDDFPIGAQAKKSQCDVAILFRQRKESDDVDIFVTKDRNYDLFSRCNSGPTPRLYGWLNKPSVENGFRASIEPDLIALINGHEVDSLDANLYKSVWMYIEENQDASGTKIEENVTGKNARIRSAIQWLVSNEFLVLCKKGNGSHYRTKKIISGAIEWRSRGDYVA